MPYSRAVRRASDFVLALVILAAVGYGAYRLGHLVDTTSTQAGEASAGTTTDATGIVTVTHHANRISRRTIETVIVAIALAAGVMLLVSVVGNLVRGKRRRQTWRAP